MALNCKRVGLRLDIRREFFTWRMVRQWHRLLRELWVSHPYGHLDTGWIGWGPRQSGPVGGVPDYERGLWNEVAFKISSNPKHSIGYKVAVMYD